MADFIGTQGDVADGSQPSMVPMAILDLPVHQQTRPSQAASQIHALKLKQPQGLYALDEDSRHELQSSKEISYNPTLFNSVNLEKLHTIKAAFPLKVDPGLEDIRAYPGYHKTLVVYDDCLQPDPSLSYLADRGKDPVDWSDWLVDMDDDFNALEGPKAENASLKEDRFCSLYPPNPEKGMETDKQPSGSVASPRVAHVQPKVATRGQLQQPATRTRSQQPAPRTQSQQQTPKAQSQQYTTSAMAQPQEPGTRGKYRNQRQGHSPNSNPQGPNPKSPQNPIPPPSNPP